jgi:hypothetical protein
MKKMLIAVGAMLAISTPAFAQSYDPSVGSGNITGAYSAPSGAHGAYLGAEGAYARVIPGRVRHRGAAAFAPQAPSVVYDATGHAVGTDPDPNIRLQLQREGDSIEGF